MKFLLRCAVAAPNIGNTKEGNIFIVAGMRQINKFNKNKFREMEKWVNKNNSLVGFEEYFEVGLVLLPELRSLDERELYESLCFQQSHHSMVTH